MDLSRSEAAGRVNVARGLVIGAVSLALAGGAVAQPPPSDVPEDVALYEIDAGASTVYWLVYSAGALARFGHNHSISVTEMTGRVLLHSEREQSRFEIDIPVHELVVDDPAIREIESDVLDSEPSAEDIAGTRGNMLSEDVLDADDHPMLRVTGTGPVVEGGSEVLDITVEILGRSIPLTVPTEVSVDGDGLEASGTFELTHDALGMEPFSALMGGLRVAEEIDFVYRIEARRAD